jgi:hypothetical protein
MYDDTGDNNDVHHDNDTLFENPKVLAGVAGAYS